MTLRAKILSIITINVILWVIAPGAHIIEDTAQARNCSGGVYEDKPGLVEECQHVREVKERQSQDAEQGWMGGGMYNCVDWGDWGSVVCYNEIEMCVPNDDCYYVKNVEDYCEYNNCTPPWNEPEPDPYPGPDTNSEPVPYP